MQGAARPGWLLINFLNILQLLIKQFTFYGGFEIGTREQRL